LNLDVPRLTYQQIKQKAQNFLNTYHPSLELPVPIEEIIEFEIGLNIYPFPNLYRTHRQNGFLSSDLTTIMVDEDQYKYYIPKYRFTLAHELGHLVLHRKIYQRYTFSKIHEYIEWYKSISNWDVDMLEWQCDTFAGLILVPEETLISECKKTIGKYKKEIKKLISSNIEVWEIWSYLPNKIASVYDVNPPVVEIRIRNSRIDSKVDLIKLLEGCP